jgi:hypothetical protein
MRPFFRPLASRMMPLSGIMFSFRPHRVSAGQVISPRRSVMFGTFMVLITCGFCSFMTSKRSRTSSSVTQSGSTTKALRKKSFIRASVTGSVELNRPNISAMPGIAR